MGPFQAVLAGRTQPPLWPLPHGSHMIGGMVVVAEEKPEYLLQNLKGGSGKTNRFLSSLAQTRRHKTSLLLY